MAWEMDPNHFERWVWVPWYRRLLIRFCFPAMHGLGLIRIEPNQFWREAKPTLPWREWSRRLSGPYARHYSEWAPFTRAWWKNTWRFPGGW